MKMKKFLGFLMAASVLMFAACGSDDDNGGDPESVSLNRTTASVEVGKSIALVATATPAGATVTWESSNRAIATVSNGTVTGVATGTAIITATVGTQSAACIVTVVPAGTVVDLPVIDPNAHPTLQGTEYFVFALDATSRAELGSRIVADFAPDDMQKFMYIWDETYAAGATSGLNFYGEPEEWTALTVTNIGWSGMGFAIDDFAELNKLSAIMDNPSEYYFHIAMKSTDQASHLLLFDGTVGVGRVAVGGDFIDGATYPSFQSITRDGEWNSIEVPMTYLLNQGLVYGSDNREGKNVFWTLSGVVPGTVLQFDAAFIYRKQSTN